MIRRRISLSSFSFCMIMVSFRKEPAGKMFDNMKLGFLMFHDLMFLSVKITSHDDLLCHDWLESQRDYIIIVIIIIGLVDVE